MLTTCPSAEELSGLDLAVATLENALEQATDAPLPDGAQCSTCDHFVDYSGLGFTQVINPDGSIEYTDYQVGVCLKQMGKGGYQSDCPNCHHQRRHKLPCEAHRSTRRTFNQCPGWEPNWDWLHGANTEF